MTETFQPSKYQQAVFEQIKNGTGNIGVNAVAGSGKTKTTVESLKLLPHAKRQGAGFIAFNKIIADELDKRINGGSKGFNSITCKTTHALGYDALRRNLTGVQKWNVNNYKYSDMAKKITGLAEFGDEKSLKDAAGSLANFSMLSMTEPTEENILELATLYNVEIPAKGERAISLAVHAMLEEGLAQAQRGEIGFQDMLWAPMKLGFKPMQFDLLAVDEAQDLNAAQMMLANAAIKPGGRILYVGDPRQAIYMFAGALSDSFDRLTNHFAAEVLPLSICYRCPTSVIELAKTIVPQIEAAPNAPAGKVEHINDARMNDLLQDGDMILCRLTAPLISQCFALISRGMTARVRGRDIGKQLSTTIKHIMKRSHFAGFLDSLYEYERAQIAALMSKPNSEAAQEAVRDKCECLATCYNYFQPKSESEFTRKVEELFADEREGVILSTIHRAKGLEAKRVFVIKPEKLPLVWKGQSEAQYQQEMNLKYVCTTRAMEELYIVDGTASGFAITPETTEPQADEETPATAAPAEQGSLFNANGEVDRNEMARAIWTTLLSCGVTLHTNGPGRLRAEFSRQEGLNSLDREAIEDYAPELYRLAAITEEGDHLISEYFEFTCPAAQPETPPSPTEGGVSQETDAAERLACAQRWMDKIRSEGGSLWLDDGDIPHFQIDKAAGIGFTKEDRRVWRDLRPEVTQLLKQEYAAFKETVNYQTITPEQTATVADDAPLPPNVHVYPGPEASEAAQDVFAATELDTLIEECRQEEKAAAAYTPWDNLDPDEEEKDDDWETEDDDEEEEEDDWTRNFNERQRRDRLLNGEL